MVRGEPKDMLRPDSFLIRFLTKVCDLMLLNIIFIFSFITVVFSGAALTALYTMTLKMVQGKEYAPIKDFLRTLQGNFISSVPATILLFVHIMLIAVFCNVFYAETPLISLPAFIILSISIIFLTALLSYLFPLLAQFENTFLRHFRNTALLTLMNLPVTFLLVIVNLLPLLCVLLFPSAIGYFAAFEELIGIAAGAYLNSFYLNRIFNH